MTYKLIMDGTARRKPLLIDSKQRRYTISSYIKKGFVWQCAVRRKKLYCCARVKQIGQEVIPGPTPHVCDVTSEDGDLP